MGGKRDVALNVEVILLDIGRLVPEKLFPSFFLFERAEPRDDQPYQRY
jgi:hypothetical protein